MDGLPILIYEIVFNMLLKQIICKGGLSNQQHNDGTLNPTSSYPDDMESIFKKIQHY